MTSCNKYVACSILKFKATYTIAQPGPRKEHWAPLIPASVTNAEPLILLLSIMAEESQSYWILAEVLMYWRRWSWNDIGRHLHFVKWSELTITQSVGIPSTHEHLLARFGDPCLYERKNWPPNMSLEGYNSSQWTLIDKTIMSLIVSVSLILPIQNEIFSRRPSGMTFKKVFSLYMYMLSMPSYSVHAQCP